MYENFEKPEKIISNLPEIFPEQTRITSVM
jgi:hypothetical protein